jgi:sulfite exporter TauE/SafE
MIDGATLAAAFALGLMGSAHCVGMCGGIGAALGLAGSRQRWLLVGCYNIGRVAGYSTLGAIVAGLSGLAGASLQELMPQFGLWLRTLAGLLVIAMGLYIGGWWLGLAHVEAIGKPVWRRIQPLAQRWLPPRAYCAALALGGAWSLLPCGLVYSGLGWAALGADPLRGAALMAAFGAGTVPAMVAITAGGKTLGLHLRRAAVRRAVAALLIVFGATTATLPWLHRTGSGHVHHTAEAATTMPTTSRILRCH